jgi:hypothetical protein
VLAFLRSLPSMQLLLLIVIAANLTFGGLAEVALPALAHLLLVMGGLLASGNTLLMPSIQATVPPAMTGRLMGVVMLCSMGAFPLAAAVAGVLVRHIGAVVYFPVSGGFFGLVIALAVTQRAFRGFGAREAPAPAP